MRFSLIIALVITVLFLTEIAYGQESIPTASSQAHMRVDYALPYPGLLPDNPLYIFKSLRDNVVGLFITESAKQAEFNLLMADKRLQAGVALLAKNSAKEALALETIASGQTYFASAITEAKQAEKQGIVVTGLGNTLALAGQKHALVLQELRESITPENEDTYTSLVKKSEQLKKDANAFGLKQR